MEELVSAHSDILTQETATQEKRSVHTKFKLSEDAIAAREWLASHWDMNQKDVAEVVARVTDRFLSGDEAREEFVEDASNQPGKLTQKTHVVSNGTRNFLKRTAKELNLTRDQFFDASLRLVHTMVHHKRKKQIEHHKELLPVLDELRARTKEVYEEVEARIDDDDPLGGTTIFGKLKHLENIVGALEEEIERGNPLETDFDFWGLPSEDDFVQNTFGNSEPGKTDKSDGSQPGVSSSNVMGVDPQSPPDLTYTKVLKAEFDGQKVFNPNWNKLLKIAHERALEEIGSFSELAQVTNSNIKKGEFDEKGYHSVTTGSRIPDFSIQGKKARTAWPDILHLAKYLHTDVFIRFKWPNKEKAVHPGKMGILQWRSTSEEQA